MAKKKVIYVVLKATSAMELEMNGKVIPLELPRGSFSIPAFTLRKDAEDLSKGKYEINEITTVEDEHKFIFTTERMPDGSVSAWCKKYSIVTRGNDFEELKRNAIMASELAVKDKVRPDQVVLRRTKQQTKKHG